MKNVRLLILIAGALLSRCVQAEPMITSLITNGLFEPYGIAVNTNNIFYISDSTHRILKYDSDLGQLTSMAGEATQSGTNDGPGFLAHFYFPRGLVIYRGGLVVADSGNHLLRFINLTGNVPVVSTFAGYINTPGLAVNTLAATAMFNSPLGLATDGTNLFIADSKNNAIRKMDASNFITTIANNLFEPAALALDTNSGNVYVADSRNNSIKVLKPQLDGSYVQTNLAGSSLNLSGTNDALFAIDARFDAPGAVYWAGVDTGLLVSDTGNHTLRRVFVNPDLTAFYGFEIWSVETYAGIPSRSGLVDGPLSSAQFKSPTTLAPDLFSGLLLVDSGNNALRRIQHEAPLPPLSNPMIGYVTMITNDTGVKVSKLLAIPNGPFYTPVTIAILGDANTVWWTKGLTPADVNAPDTVPTPRRNDGVSAQPPIYFDGMTPDQLPITIVLPTPDVTVKAISSTLGRLPSQIVRARIQFKTATPTFSGDNPFSFQIDNETPGAEVWYTLAPKVASNNVKDYGASGPFFANDTISLPPAVLSLMATGDVILKFQAFASGYQNSDIVAKNFSLNNFNATRISFGFQYGECSSDFVAGQGQTFYAPVTLSLLGNESIYSLQFNVTITNYLAFNLLPTNIWGANLGNTSLLGANQWITNLWSSSASWGTNLSATNLWVTNLWSSSWFTNLWDTNQWIADFFDTNHLSIDPSNTNLWLTNLWGTNLSLTVTKPPSLDPTSLLFRTSLWKPQDNVLVLLQPQMFSGAVTNIDMVFSNYHILPTYESYLLGVGWLERMGNTNLYDTKSQELITYSIAHDTQFLKANKKIVLGGFRFQVPANAAIGQNYRIQINRPSATSDGVGTDLFLYAPTNGSRTVGAINSIKDVRVGQRKYLVGDVAPFRWFNAGDFGDNSLLNNDVLQVFQSVVYHLNVPLPGSDMFDAMDSSDGFVDPTLWDVIFGGTDQVINTIMQGDGRLMVDDVYVTFRRSLDPSLTNYVRYWSNGVRVAEPTNNTFRGQPFKPSEPIQFNRADLPKNMPDILNSDDHPSAFFVAGDAIAQPGQVMRIPISAQIAGKYPVRVMMFNLNVEPLDGSTPITEPVQFIPASGLGASTLTLSQGPANYAAAWLNESSLGLWGNAVAGYLRVTIPANASPNAAYRMAFEHLSASPNGLAIFPTQLEPGLITLTNRLASSWQDGIPDSWRLRYFGSVSNLLSDPDADADGDGVPNWAEYKAGTDPTDATSILRLISEWRDSGATTSQPGLVLRWPGASNRTYIIEWSSSIVGPVWNALSPNLTGLDGMMEYQDTTVGTAPRYYRVRVAP